MILNLAHFSVVPKRNFQKSPWSWRPLYDIVAFVWQYSCRSGHGTSHLCDSKVAGPAVQRDTVLATRCEEYPRFCYPLSTGLFKEVRVFKGVRTRNWNLFCWRCEASEPLKRTVSKDAQLQAKKSNCLRGLELNTNFSFSSFSGTSGISRQNPGISRQWSLISLVSRDIPNFWAPPLHVEDPYPTGKYPDSKVWVVLFFRAWLSGKKLPTLETRLNL